MESGRGDRLARRARDGSEELRMPLDEPPGVLGESLVELGDAAARSVVATVAEPLDHAPPDLQRDGRADEGGAEQPGLRLVGLRVQAGAHLAQLADRHDVDVLAQAQLLEVEHLGRPAEGLDFVDPDRDALLAAQLDQRHEELPRGDVEPALALHQLHDEARMLPGVASHALPQPAYRLVDRAVGPIGIEEGDVIHGDGQRQPHAVGRRVSDLGHGRGPAREAAAESQNSRCRRVLLEAQLERRLVGHRPGVDQEGVLERR